MTCSGILYQTLATVSSADESQFEQLPLEEVKVKVLIIDVTARVTLTQRFFNQSSVSTGRCKYCFPVPASAAVCAFDMQSSDGQTIKGQCEEKDCAKEQYESAIAAGKVAGLLDYVTDDIFAISVGSIAPHAIVEIKLVYVMPLGNGDYSNQARFQLPMHVGQRYGAQPVLLIFSAEPSSRTKISITADIQMAGRILSITSPSHATDIVETKHPTHLGRLSRRRTTIRFRSQVYLERDFVLMIQAGGLDSPRCFAELRRDLHNKHPETIALQLTMVPKSKLPIIYHQEYHFLLDRSGSMSGPRIETAKSTLKMMLRMLPTDGSLFNVSSFGNSVEQLWASSQVYSQQTLLQATQNIERMGADLGGTEIDVALERAFSTCSSELPTAIFLLTDGEVYDTERTKQLVKGLVAKSVKQRRVFTLGIGEGVSSDTCEGIARAGNGVCLFAVNAESIIGKCAQLFRAGRTPFVRNINLDWGVDQNGDSPEVTFSSQPSPRTVAPSPLPIVQQAPHKVNDIHSGTRLNIFAIISLKKRTVPKVVVLSGELDSEIGQEFRLEIPVREVQLVDVEEDLPMIHTMAAWRLIQEHMEGRAPLPTVPDPITPTTERELRRTVIVQLGVQYQLATSYTSFIAVEGERDRPTGRRMKETFFSRHPHYAVDTRNSSTEDLGAENSVSGLKGIATDIWNACKGLVSSFLTTPTISITSSDNPIPGSWLTNQSPDDSSIQTFSTLSSLEQATDISDWSSASSQIPEDYEQGMPSPRLGSVAMALETDHSNQADQLARQPATPVPIEVIELVTLQQCDGSFCADRHFEKIVGTTAIEGNKCLDVDVDDTTWATVLYVAFLHKNLQDNPDLFEDLVAKSLEFFMRRGIENVESLIQKAKEFLS